MHVSQLSKIQSIPGVLAVQSPHFWTLCSGKFTGGLKIEVSFNCDPRYILLTTKSMLAQLGIEDAYIQIDYPTS